MGSLPVKGLLPRGLAPVLVSNDTGEKNQNGANQAAGTGARNEVGVEAFGARLHRAVRGEGGIIITMCETNERAAPVQTEAASKTKDLYTITSTADCATPQSAQHSHPGNLPATAGGQVDLFDYEAVDAAWRRVKQKRLQKRLARARNRAKVAATRGGRVS